MALAVVIKVEIYRCDVVSECLQKLKSAHLLDCLDIPCFKTPKIICAGQGCCQMISEGRGG